jgi:hypothetical protein
MNFAGAGTPFMASVFHSPQDGHLGSQDCELAAQPEQANAGLYSLSMPSAF